MRLRGVSCVGARDATASDIKALKRELDLAQWYIIATGCWISMLTLSIFKVWCMPPKTESLICILCHGRLPRHVEMTTSTRAWFAALYTEPPTHYCSHKGCAGAMH